MYRTRLIIPGMTMLNMGNSFRNPHKTQPPFTWDKFFPARQPWTKICRGNLGAAWGGCFLRVCEPGPPLHRQDRTAGTCSSSRGCPGAGSGVPNAHPTHPVPPGTQGLRRHV